jgi:ubiquinone/menaquinone biosynthesis C-methylase UbiE
MAETGFACRDLEAIASMPRYYAWKSSLVGRHAGRRVLEVGCGTGLVLERLGSRELLLGVDRDAECLGAAHARLAGRGGIEVRECDVLSGEFLSFAGRNPDTVLFVNTLELVQDDLLALRQSAAVLGRGGKLVVLASALPALAGKLDRAHGQKRYTRAGLTGLMKSAGFIVESARFVNLAGVMGWWLDSRVRGKQEMSPAAYRNRDRFIPLARLVDALTGPPLGSLILAVGVRE